VAGLGSAYQRCQDRVREVAQAIVGKTGVWFSVLELQTKTGEGFPHWHLMVQVEEGVSIEQVQAAVRRKWCTVVDHHVDEITGEVVQSRESIGFSDVEECRSDGGTARYLAKYICKPWEAIPEWMKQSDRQLRKYRHSAAFFRVAELLDLHHPKRGPRRQPSGRRRPARTLIERMSTSCSTSIIIQKCGDSFKFRRTVRLPIMSDRWSKSYDAKCIRLGKVPATALVISHDAYRILGRDAAHPDFPSESEALETYQRAVIDSAWHLMQSRRAKETEDDPGGTVVAARLDSPG
jgi:hypothetical protein